MSKKIILGLMSGFSAPARVYSFNGKLSVAGEKSKNY